MEAIVHGHEVYGFRNFDVRRYDDLPVEGRVAAFALALPRGEIRDDPLRNFLRGFLEEVQGCFLAQDAVGVVEVADAVVSAVLYENVTPVSEAT